MFAQEDVLAVHGQGHYLSALQCPYCHLSLHIRWHWRVDGHFGDLSKEKLSLVGYTCVLDIYYYYIIYIKYTHLYPTKLIYIHIHVCVYVSIYLYVTVVSMYV